tara:strand:+ start:1283 stop:3277 length:1995 start_codon:yes stop_codon:yes gene_type:complete
VKEVNLTFKYLDHIDALRALSVIAVILFHLNPDTFYLGFLGVDIFFVISGYVISNSIYEQQILQKKSIIQFYIKRFKRIFPILFLVICTFFFLYIFLSPLSGKSNFFFISGATSLLGVSNFYFLNNEINYFLNESINPLLHTWSLGVEEQFYLIYPIFIIYLFSVLKNNFEKIFLIILILIFLSFLMYFFTSGITGNFYFSISRFWQIGLGCLAYFYFSLDLNYKRILNTLILIIIVTILFKFNSDLNTKELNLIASLLCFILIISLRKTDKKSRLNVLIIKSKLPYLGKISYSLYLWHLPVLYFCEIYFTGITSFLIFFVTSLFLSIISYHLFENPLRKSKKFEEIILKIPKYISIISVSCILIFFIISNLDFKKNFYKTLKKFNYPELKLQNYLDRIDFKYLNHLQSDCSEVKSSLHCKKKESNNHVIYLSGDSHAEHFLPTVDGLNIIDHFYFNNFAHCEIILKSFSKPNIIDVDPCDINYETQLKNLNKKLSDYENKTVIISIRLSHYLKKDWRLNNTFDQSYNNKVQTIKYNFEKFFNNFEDTKFILINAIPESKIHTEECIFNEFLRKQVNYEIYNKCHFKKKSDEERYLNFTKTLNSIKKNKKNVFIFDPYSILCPEDICHNFDFDKDFFVLIDKDHLSIEASKYLSHFLNKFLRRL